MTYILTLENNWASPSKEEVYSASSDIPLAVPPKLPGRAFQATDKKIHSSIACQSTTTDITQWQNELQIVIY